MLCIAWAEQLQILPLGIPSSGKIFDTFGFMQYVFLNCVVEDGEFKATFLYKWYFF